ncbi:MAG: hypothetical protein PHR00_01385 [Patescibacteria group bacterium]|nr:hypothetical protein [Patescibacteria group bacterium]
MKRLSLILADKLKFIYKTYEVTYLGITWRAIMFVLDWRNHLNTFWRLIKNFPKTIWGQPIDVVFISNLRDSRDRQLFLGVFNDPKDGFFNSARIKFKGLNARILMINSDALELFRPQTKKIAQKQFMNAVAFAVKRGAKVILFAAGVKRLFNKQEMNDIQKQYPDILFTIGDNGTAITLISDIEKVIKLACPSLNKIKFVVLGPSGHLGKAAIAHFSQDKRYEIYGLGSDLKRSKLIANKFGTKSIESFAEINEADIVIACTHDDKLRLNQETIEQIKPKQRKLIVIDVAEPKNLTKDEYEQCQHDVVVIHTGDPYSSKLKYVAQIMSTHILRLKPHIIFGCFAEALVLGLALKDKSLSLSKALNNKEYPWFDSQKKEYDWLEVNDRGKAMILALFKKYGFELGYLRNFKGKIKSIELSR